VQVDSHLMATRATRREISNAGEASAAAPISA
jgi:hypothetical protein